MTFSCMVNFRDLLLRSILIFVKGVQIKTHSLNRLAVASGLRKHVSLHLVQTCG